MARFRHDKEDTAVVAAAAGASKHLSCVSSVTTEQTSDTIILKSDELEDDEDTEAESPETLLLLFNFLLALRFFAAFFMALFGVSLAVMVALFKLVDFFFWEALLFVFFLLVMFFLSVSRGGGGGRSRRDRSRGGVFDLLLRVRDPDLERFVGFSAAAASSLSLLFLSSIPLVLVEMVPPLLLLRPRLLLLPLLPSLVIGPTLSFVALLGEVSSSVPSCNGLRFDITEPLEGRRRYERT